MTATGSDLVSPRIATLRQQLAGGDTTALEAFWDELAATGTPLIEPATGDPDHSLVTFVWRARGPTSTVALDSPALRQAGIARWRDNQLTRMPGTDLFYRTYSLPNKLRASYLFSQDPPLIALTDPPEEALASFRAFLANPSASQPDPLNPKRVVEHLGRQSAPRSWSLFALQDAPAQPWSARREGNERGVLHIHSFRSAILGNERDITAYTPPGYSPGGQPCDLLLVFDSLPFVPTTLDNLLADRRIAPTVAVLIDIINMQTRRRELSCHEPFVDFLAAELLPWLRSKYNLTTDPRRVVVSGVSAGGQTSAFAALRHPDLFGNVLSQSGAFYWGPGFDAEKAVQTQVAWEWLPRQFEISPRLPIRFYLNVGLLETGEVDMLRSNRRMRDVLTGKGYDVTCEEFYGGHDFAVWQGLFAEGLLALRS